MKRPSFTLGLSDWDSFFAKKTILVTGAAGSIGSTLSLALMEGLANRLILLDRSTQGLEHLYRKYQERNFTLPAVEFIQADILCQNIMDRIFSSYQPDTVFHAAALKHVPELEYNPFAALENNVLGTVRLLQVAQCFEVECFINVSTDKAVNPTSVLGISKRLTELLLLAIQSPFSRRLSVRLGNVLGSSGSVVRHFLAALRQQQPLRITDPLASRYFLTVEETAAFLLQSSQLPATSLLLPDMGLPLKITDLAAFLLSEVKHESAGVGVNFIGLKDGEKVSEQLTYGYEYLQDTKTPRLYKIFGNKIDDPERFADTLGRLLELVIHRTKEGLLDYLLHLIPEFHPSATLLRHIG